MLREHNHQRLALGFALLVCLCGSLFLPIPANSQAAPPAPRAQPQVNQSDSNKELEARVREGFANIGAKKLDLAEQQFKDVLERALQAKDQHAEAGARGGLGVILVQRGQFVAAREQMEKALELMNVLGDRLNAARAESGLGDIAFNLEDYEKARGYYTDVLHYAESVGDIHGQANAWYRLSESGGGNDGQGPPPLERAYALAEKIGDKKLLAAILEDMGDHLFTSGDFQGAIEKLSKSAALEEEVGNRQGLSYVLTSMGRVQRAHGHPELALGLYQRALDIQREIQDTYGMVQSLDALAVTYGLLNDTKQAVAHFEEALSLARESGSPKLINFVQGAMADEYEREGNHTRAAELLEELLKRHLDPYQAQYRLANLGGIYLTLGKYQQALDATNRALEIARGENNNEWLPNPLLLRARVEDKLGRTAEALADVRENLARIEEIRAHLAPSDFYRRDFSDLHAQTFSLAVELLVREGRPGEALETADRARSRGFVDLLASRKIEIGSAEREKLEALQKAEGEIQTAAAATPATATDSSAPHELATRGAMPVVTTRGSAKFPAEPDLLSVVSTGSASLQQMREQSARLHSTIMTYWVGDESTFVWVLNSEDSVHAARIPVKREHLAELVRGVWPLEGGPEANSTASASEGKTPHTSPRVRDETQFPSRGQSELRADRTQKDRWRELYRLLIEPIESYLPSLPGARITIIPHGPLFALPFAGLRDAQNRYLLERYTLQYAPTISVFQFTAASAANVDRLAPHFLLVADPSGMQKLGLPQLPGSRREVSDVARGLPPDEVTMLTGADVQTAAVRSAAARSTVLHFATHGIIDDSKPFDSFLALADGKLTARDIYGLNLNADLVFLSACRSGMGRVTGDGVLGLTRAFLYAGTRSVVATLWDVADEPTAQLVSTFYRNVRQNSDKAQALRSAQLSVLRQLRAGKLQVATRRGPLTLPENPIFWASFVLIGEP
jgi:CHAT domain-containing protein/tetratricopeptide (TPR) repeat protein